MPKKKKQRNRLIHPIDRPTLIVGMWPGNQRKNDHKSYVFHGNKTGDFVEKLVEGYTNIILTNSTNYLDPTKEEKIKGERALRRLIVKFKPKRIICFGNVARVAVLKIDWDLKLTTPIHTFNHPSFFLRFQAGSKTRSEAIETFRESIRKYL